MASNAPVKKFKIGYVTVSVWKNGGTNGDWYNATIERAYKDDDGNIQNTNSLSHADMVCAMTCLHRAEHWIAAQ